MQRGFTLLELLVVLVIIGLTSSFAGPNLWKSYDKSQQRATIEQFVLSLNEYRLKAYKTGKSIEFASNYTDTQTKQALPALPNGWTLEQATSLRFLATGVTNGAHYYFKSNNRQWQLIISPLDGHHEITIK